MSESEFDRSPPQARPLLEGLGSFEREPDGRSSSNQLGWARSGESGPDPINTKSAYSVLPLAPEDEQIEQLRPAVYDGHGVGKQCADGSA